VVTTDLRLNEPRYVKLPDIMKAKKKPLDQITLTELGVEPSSSLREISYKAPPQRSRGVIVDDVASLVAALSAKGLV
jgi:electron transfer flavoprotein beta subunit